MRVGTRSSPRFRVLLRGKEGDKTSKENDHEKKNQKDRIKHRTRNKEMKQRTISKAK